MLQDEMLNLCRDKFIIKEELTKAQIEIGKLRILIQRLQNENNDLIHELKLQNKNTKVQIKRVEVPGEPVKESTNNQKINQYKEIIK